MRIAIDIDSGEVKSWDGAPITAPIAVKRRDKFPLEVRYTRNGAVVARPENATGTLGIKATGNYSSSLLASSSSWTASGYGTNKVYTFTVNLNTTAMETAFAADPATLTVDAEICTATANDLRSSATFKLLVANDVIRGDEESPEVMSDGKATQAEAEAGTDNTKWMTPLRTAQAIGLAGLPSSNGLTLNNGAKLQEGTTDAGLGGNKGIALKCSVDYELKWEAGRLYTMEQDGFTIRSVEHCFTTVPTGNDDETKGFIVGSRWILDNGTVYQCSSADEGEAQWEVATTGGGSSNYILKAEDFTAEAGKSYAVDAVSTTIPEHHFIYGGLYVRGNWEEGDAATFGWEVGATWLGNGPAAVGFTFPAGATLSDIIANAAGFTFSLAPGANGSDLFPEQTFTGNMGSYNLTGGSATTIAAQVTLPANPSTGDVVTFADARGTWGDHPLTVLRNGKKIEGGTSDFTNNAAGTFFSMVYIDATTGWRILASGTKPLNLTAPSVSGTYSFTSTNGTWTGSPTSYSHKWQISDDGETNWNDIIGATSDSYQADPADEGKYVRVGVTAINSNGPSIIVYSAPSSAIVVPTFPLDGLVAFYNMAGTADSSENGYDLTNSNNTVFQAGRVGNAATFAFESGSRLSVDYLPWHLGSSDATFSIWMKPSTGEFGANTTVAGFYQSGGFALLLSNYGTEIYFSQGGANLMTLEAEVQNNEWIHVAFVKTSAHYKVYVNGMEETASRWNNNGVLNKGPETTTFYFGDCTPPGWPGVYNGQIDAVGFWNRALSAMEIALLYNNGDGAEP